MSIANALTDEAKIAVNGGISYKIVDPAHVSMLTATFPKEDFEEFADGEEFEFGLDIEKTLEFLKNAKKNDIVTIEYYPENETDRISFSVRNVTNKYHVLDIDGMADPKVPELRLRNSVVVFTKEIQEYLKHNKKLSDYFTVSWENDTFKMFIDGESDTGELKIAKTLLPETDIIDGTVKSMFSYDYFKIMIDQIKSDTVKIHWDGDSPTTLEWRVGKHGTVKNLLAPRIEDE